MNTCPTRRLPSNPGVSLALPDGTRLSVVKSGKSLTGSAGNLPSGFWLTDLSYSEVRLLDGQKTNRIIHPDGWLGAPWRQIMQDCGLTDRSPHSQIRTLAELSERVINLSVRAVTRSDLWGGSNRQISDRRTFGRPSLAFGLSEYFRLKLKCSRPRHSALSEPSRSLLLYGARVGNAKFREGRILTAAKPRFSHLRWLAEQPVPGSNQWCQIDSSNCVSPMTDSAEAGLRSLKRPVILSGAFQPFQLGGTAWCRGWLRGSDPTWGRRWFTLEEAICLRRAGNFFVDGAFAGPAQRRPADRTLLGMAARGLTSACGGERAARCSWSAGLAAENLIRAACGRFKSVNAPAPMEAVWIAALDRISCLPGIEAAEDAGGAFLASAAGAVTFGVRGDAAAARVADALWKAGFHLSAGAARRLKSEGVNLLSDAAAFGGNEEDLFMAAASQLGLCGLVRRMDSIAGGGKAGKKRRLNALESALARFPS